MEAAAKKIYAPDELVCAVAIHPGEMLKDELQARGMSQRKFAGIIGMPYTAFNEIINGKRPITTDTALKIEAATGISATIWLGLQTDYNMQTARRDNKLSAILENHLGNPNPVRVPRPAPRQIPAVPRVPAHQCSCKIHTPSPLKTSPPPSPA